MKRVLVCLLFFYGANLVVAQGGKAEPNRIQFGADRMSITLSGTLSSGQEVEYLLAAAKRQRVTVKNAPANLFDFKVFSEEFFSEGDFDSSPSYTFEIPETGDYMLFV